MIKLNSLKNLISKLNDEEYTSVINFLKFNSPQTGRANLKSVLLVEIAKDKQAYTSNEIQKTIYGNVNHVAFNKLVNRVYTKVLDVIILDSNLYNGKYSSRNKVVFELRKKVLQVDLLILKGIRENIEREIDYIIHKSRTFEIYDVLIQALYSKQRFLTLQNNPKKAGQIKNSILEAERCWTAFNSSQAIFNSISSKINSSTGDRNFELELNSAVQTLKDSYDQTKSPTILYYYLFLATEISQRKKEFRKASSYLEALLRNVTSNKSVYTDSRCGSTLINISNNHILTYEFGKAESRIIEAKKYFKDQPVNLSIAEEIEFIIQLYSDNIEKAEVNISKLASSSSALNVPLLLSKWTYMKACICFLKRKYGEAIDLFNQSSEIQKDKEGWNFTKRIMILISRIELNDLDSADLDIQSLDKFMKRLQKDRHIRPRLILIVRILRKLIDENFDYNKVYRLRKKYFDKLMSNDADYKWEIKSPELIVFEEWFVSKMNKSVYNPNNVIRRLNVLQE